MQSVYSIGSDAIIPPDPADRLLMNAWIKGNN
jgi:hypothetical protein